MSSQKAEDNCPLGYFPLLTSYTLSSLPLLLMPTLTLWVFLIWIAKSSARFVEKEALKLLNFKGLEELCKYTGKLNSISDHKLSIKSPWFIRKNMYQKADSIPLNSYSSIGSGSQISINKDSSDALKFL